MTSSPLSVAAGLAIAIALLAGGPLRDALLATTAGQPVASVHRVLLAAELGRIAVIAGAAFHLVRRRGALRSDLAAAGRALASRRGRRIALFAGALGATALAAPTVREWHAKRQLWPERARESWIARAERVRDAAATDYDAKALAALDAHAMHGDVVRLDDRWATARLREHAGGRHDAFVARLLRWPTETDGSPGLVARDLAGTTTVLDGPIVVRGDRLVTHAQPIALDEDRIGTLEIRARTTNAASVLLGWNHDGRVDTTWENRLAIDLLPDGQWHTYVVDIHHALRTGQGDPVRRIQLGYRAVGSEVVEVSHLEIRSRDEAFSEQPVGQVYESLAHDLRRALYLWPGHDLDLSVTIPARATLETALGALPGGSPCRAAATVVADGSEAEVLRVEAGPSWQRAEASLDRWAGRAVVLRLTAEAEGGICLFAHPTIRGPRRQPFNVLILLEDTLRADHLSTYGYHRPTAPTRTAIAEEGVHFELPFSQATKTRPSVPALMTSLLPSATGVWNWSHRLAESYVTLAEVLRDQGFVTASFVQNGNAGPYAGLHQGFERVLTSEVVGNTTDAHLTELVDEWILDHRDRNFFLYLHVVPPHGPYDPSVQSRGWYEALDADARTVARDPILDPQWVTTPTQEGRRARYDGEILDNDEWIARLLETLRVADLERDTLLVLLSDHGEHLGEHGLWAHHPPGYRQVTHVPLVMRYPARLAPDRVASPVQLIDVMPTVLELAGVDSAPLAMHGQSLLALLGAEGADAPRLALSEEPTGARPDEACGCGSVITPRFHLIRSDRLTGGGEDLASGGRIVSQLSASDFEIFDLADDPQEERPIEWMAADDDIRADVIALLEEVQRANVEAARRFAPVAAEPTLMDPAVQQQLRSLGYIE